MFASEEGFRHHCVTPLHPQANGEAENFMKLLNKTEQRARIENKPVRLAIQELLTGYRSTPHPATGVTPYDAMMDRKVRTKLDYVQPDLIAGKVKQSKVNKRDMEYKMEIKSNAEYRNTKSHNLTIGDYVLFQQTKINKWTPPYNPKHYIVYKIRGSTIWARRVTDGREVCRDSTCFKKVNKPRGHMITHKARYMMLNQRKWSLCLGGLNEFEEDRIVMGTLFITNC